MSRRTSEGDVDVVHVEAALVVARAVGAGLVMRCAPGWPAEVRAGLPAEVRPIHDAVVGRELRRARVAAGIAQSALADASGVPQGRICLAERGRVVFSAAELDAVATGLRRTPWSLLDDVAYAVEFARVTSVLVADAAARRPSRGCADAAARDDWGVLGVAGSGLAGFAASVVDAAAGARPGAASRLLPRVASGPPPARKPRRATHACTHYTRLVAGTPLGRRCDFTGTLDELEAHRAAEHGAPQPPQPSASPGTPGAVE